MQHFKDVDDNLFDYDDDVTQAQIDAARPGLISIDSDQWDNLRQPSAEVRLQKAKDARKEYMRRQAASEIASSFTSNALGSTHTYDSREVDQTNLIMARDEAELSNPQEAQVYANNGTEYAYRTHTLGNIKQVIADCSKHVRPIREKLINKKSAVDASSDPSSIDW